MENFRKVRSEEAPAGGGGEGGSLGSSHFADLAPGTVQMRVKEGSKIRNLMAFTTTSMAQPAMCAIIFSGCSRATNKTVTCTEILKRRLVGLHKVTRLHYRSVCEVWQSLPPGPTQGQTPGEPASSLSVLKNMQGLAILLSKDALDLRQPSYQPQNPHPSPSSPQMSKRSLGEPATGEGSAKRSQPEPGAADEDQMA
ncbi:Ribonuclease P protein subunit p25 [Saguinus oedipus]|uniref:Ribonuclease P protein subunit p25 n=1 Tax=Saguinus oedipus TaxID=9490 RepID=A0ABQ9W1Q0_SAGOE|nr:Ribonuclease P protein subunit p25 [Saguinus oedipus]